MIHVELEKETVEMLNREGRLRAFLADQLFVDRFGNVGKFMMDLPIDSQKVSGSKGEMVVFYQEELDDAE